MNSFQLVKCEKEEKRGSLANVNFSDQNNHLKKSERQKLIRHINEKKNSVTVLDDVISIKFDLVLFVASFPVLLLIIIKLNAIILHIGDMKFLQLLNKEKVLEPLA